MADIKPTQHRAICPTCGTEAVREISTRERYTITANFDCLNGHIWVTRWPTPAAVIN